MSDPYHYQTKQDLRCSLERLAREIFDHHTRGKKFEPKRSGAEWWVQVRGGATNKVNQKAENRPAKKSRTEKSPGSGETGDDDSDNARSGSARSGSSVPGDAQSGSSVPGIGFHWDKDEDLVDSTGVNVNPQISTVTYVTVSMYVCMCVRTLLIALG